jgi:acetolactate synthase-1/2/3 large subunit
VLNLTSDAVPIHPLPVAKELNDSTTEESVFIGDGGDVVTILAKAIHPKRPGHWMNPGPLGVGTPFSSATKVARPGEEVVILLGGGAFGCTGFDHDTLIHFDLPVVGVISNNAARSQIRFGRIDKYGRERGDVANLLNSTGSDDLVVALGGFGEHVTEPEDIRPALECARESAKPVLVNIMVDPNVLSAGTMCQTMYR